MPICAAASDLGRCSCRRPDIGLKCCPGIPACTGSKGEEPRVLSILMPYHSYPLWSLASVTISCLPFFIQACQSSPSSSPTLAQRSLTNFHKDCQNSALTIPSASLLSQTLGAVEACSLKLKSLPVSFLLKKRTCLLLPMGSIPIPHGKVVYD